MRRHVRRTGKPFIVEGLGRSLRIPSTHTGWDACPHSLTVTPTHSQTPFGRESFARATAPLTTNNTHSTSFSTLIQIFPRRHCSLLCFLDCSYDCFTPTVGVTCGGGSTKRDGRFLRKGLVGDTLLLATSTTRL
jgi:hypothetical protein